MADSDLRLQSELRVQQGFGRFDCATVSRKRQQNLRLRLLDVAGVHSVAAGYTSESACTNLHAKGQVHEGKIQDVSSGKGVLVPGQWDRQTGDAWNKRSGAALRVLHAKNEAERQTAINLQIARAYLAAADPEIATRNWQFVMDEMGKLNTGATHERWLRAVNDKAFDSIRNLPIIETRPEHFLDALGSGRVSTNVFLRRIHNFALDMTWLPWPVIPKRQWPEVRFKEKRAITWEEHQAIIAREPNVERKAFYQLAWHLGAAQSDLAHLVAEDIDWGDSVISFRRKKTGTVSLIRFGDEVAEILRSRPTSGPLFTYLRTVRAGDRATEFKQRCDGLGINGVSLHSYRYS